MNSLRRTANESPSKTTAPVSTLGTATVDPFISIEETAIEEKDDTITDFIRDESIMKTAQHSKRTSIAEGQSRLESHVPVFNQTYQIGFGGIRKASAPDDDFFDKIGSTDLQRNDMIKEYGNELNISLQSTSRNQGYKGTISPTSYRHDSLSFENSRFLTAKKVDPRNLLPPASLSVRDNADSLKKELTYPTSPAFVNIYKMGKETELTDASDFCRKKNIPFN